MSLHTALPAAGAEVGFADVPVGHWAAAEIGEMAGRQVVQGTGDGLFYPDRPVSYGEWLAMVTREFYFDRVGPQRSPWYDTYLTAAEEGGLLVDTAGMALPEEPISRYEMAQILSHVVREQGEAWESWDVADRIGDWEEIPERYRQAVALCYDLGLLNGVDGEGSFDGLSSVTRAEAAVVMKRLIGDRPYLSEERGLRCTLNSCYEGRSYSYIPDGTVEIQEVAEVLIRQVMDSLLVYDPGRSYQLTGYHILSLGAFIWDEEDGSWLVLPQVEIAWTGWYSFFGYQSAREEWTVVGETGSGLGPVRIRERDGIYTLTCAAP